jgi:hypothetical protein
MWCGVCLSWLASRFHQRRQPIQQQFDHPQHAGMMTRFGISQIISGRMEFPAGTASINYFRAESSLAHQYGPPKRAARLRKVHLCLTWLSLTCFVVGCVLVIIGGFITLAGEP